jgi:hypothetical protein
MHCLIGFFGLTRSLSHTVESIRWAFLEPLREAGIPVLTAGHFNLPETIDNARTGEDGVLPNRSEATLLDLDLCWVERQLDEGIATEMAAIRALPDAYGDNYVSLTNLCHQLRSLDRLWSLLHLFAPRPDDIVLLLRPDLLYLDRLDPERDLPLLTSGKADIVLPSWQSWGGLNDRFAFCSVREARVYATRFRLIAEACQDMRGMHAEQFLRFVVSCHDLRVGLTDLRAARIRANGRIPPNDQSMITPDSAAMA